MDDNIFSRLRLCLTLIGLVMFGWGCGSSTNSASDEDRNPYVQKAKASVQEQDFKAAVALYQKALLVNPQMADAHFEVGMLYDDKLGDPIAAIYHYRRFLELRPDSSKRQLVEDFIERAKYNLVSKLPQSPVAEPGELTRLQNEKANLLQENATLQQRVSELEKSSERQEVVMNSLPPPAAPPLAPQPVAVVVPAEPARSRTHVVQRGDTLYSLAQQYYGSKSDWAKIWTANRTQLASKDQLKVGQQLVIP